MKTIKRVKLHNFKRFSNFQLNLDDKLNVLVGENEVGKSSISSAITLPNAWLLTKIGRGIQTD